MLFENLMPFASAASFSLLSGFHRNSQEKAGLLEAAGPETAPPVPSKSYAGHACVPTERVRLCWPSFTFDLSL